MTDPGLDPAERQDIYAQHFLTVPLHQLLGVQLEELGDDFCVFSMPVTPAAFNSTGNLHGGAIATLVDIASGSAAAVGSKFRPGEQTLVTADMHVRYLGRPTGDVVRARGQVVRAGRQLIVVETQVRDDADRVIAMADFSAMIVPLRGPLRPSESARATDPDL